MGETHSCVSDPGPHKLLYTLPNKHWNDTGMNAIPRKYITDAKNQKQAVIVDLETFNRMESIIEDNGLAKFMDEAEEDETLSVHEAKKHYRSLKKDLNSGVRI
jgi:PHD/YefM family antitoxin component YafN of YafNO toxin-antitoxin module